MNCDKLHKSYAVVYISVIDKYLATAKAKTQWSQYISAISTITNSPGENATAIKLPLKISRLRLWIDMEMMRSDFSEKSSTTVDFCRNMK